MVGGGSRIGPGLRSCDSQIATGRNRELGSILQFSFCTDKLLLNRERCADSYDEGLRGTYCWIAGLTRYPRTQRLRAQRKKLCGRAVADMLSAMN